MEKLRVSSYMIPVKLEQEEDKYILVHGYTGAIDIVSGELLNDIQSVGEKDDLVQPKVVHLLKRGYLTRKTQEEEYAYVKRIARALHKRDTMLLHKVFTFVVTYNCNFRCPYCFEGRELKDVSHSLVFTPEMVDKAYQAMEMIEPQEQLRSKIIFLYGGEPLLKENKGIVSYIIQTGHRKGYKFNIVTNGYDLEDFIEILTPDYVSKVQITVDGTKEYHNQRRIHYLTHDTFDKIVSNIELALKQGIKVAVRVNSDERNVENFFSLKAYFESVGFYSYPNFKLYSAIITNNTSITSDERKELDLISSHTYLLKHKKMKTEDYCKDFRICERIYTAICNKQSVPFNTTFCGAQLNGYVLDPLGEIYPCWDMVGNRQFVIGNYRDNSIKWNNDILAKWHNQNISTDSVCRTCKYALFCGGGCIAHSLNGDKSHCAYFREIFKLAVTKAYDRASNCSKV